MPGVNEASPLAKKVDAEYSEPTLENFFHGFRGMRWERMTTTSHERTMIAGVETTSPIVHTEVRGFPAKAIVGMSLPNLEEDWWALTDANMGVYFLDDLAR